MISSDIEAEVIIIWEFLSTEYFEKFINSVNKNFRENINEKQQNKTKMTMIL